MKLNPLDSSLLTVIDGSQKVMDTLYKLTLTFCPDMIEQYSLVTSKSYKIKKKSDKTLYGNPDVYNNLVHLNEVPFTKLLYEYSKDKWDVFKEELTKMNDNQWMGGEYNDAVSGLERNARYTDDNKTINKVYAGFLPNLELITKNSHFVSAPRIEIRRRYDPEIYTHLMHRNSFWYYTDGLKSNERPFTTNFSVNEDPINTGIVQGNRTDYDKTNGNYIDNMNEYDLFEMGDNVRMIIDTDSSINNLAKVIRYALDDFFGNNKEEFIKILEEMTNSGLFSGLSTIMNVLRESDSDDLPQSTLDELESFSYTVRSDETSRYNFLINCSNYFAVYIYSSLKKYNLDKNYEFLKKLEEFVNVRIEEYIISVEVSAIMTTAAWHNLYGGNNNFYKEFTSRIYNSMLQLNAKEMRLFSKRHAINKYNPYVQNRDSISGRTIRNATHNLYTLLTFLLSSNDKVDYMGIRSNTKKYRTYGSFNKKVGVLVGTLINRISEFSSVVSNNKKTVVGIKNQKFLVEDTIEIGNRALSQITDKGLKIKIQSLIENSNSNVGYQRYQSDIGDDDYLAMQNYMYTASVYKLVLIATLTYVSALISENPNEMDYNYLQEDYYQARYQTSKNRLVDAKNLLSKNFDKYDNSPWDYQCFPLGSLSDSFVIRDSYKNKKDYRNDYKRKRDGEELLTLIFEEMNKRYNGEYNKYGYFEEIRDISSTCWSMIGITSKEEKDFVYQALNDLIDDDLLELHSDANEMDIMGKDLDVYTTEFDTHLSSSVDIKNIPINILNNNTLSATESLDITLNLPLLLQSLENIVYENTSDPRSKEEFLNKLATLDAAYYRFIKKDIAEYEKK